jgi:hypothetical protein
LHALGQYQNNGLLLWDCPDLASYFILHALKQYLVNAWLLWDRPDACFVLRFTRAGAISG